MGMHMNEVGSKARHIFAEVRGLGKRVLEEFHRGFLEGCNDVHKGWKSLQLKERKAVFDRVQKVALEIMVDIKDGGNAENGITLATFYGYAGKVKKALIYSCPLSIAERATIPELQAAQKHVQEVLKGTRGSAEDKMSEAYDHVKQQQIERKQQMRDEAKKNRGVSDTPFTLPCPSDYEDSEQLLNEVVQSILNMLQSKSMQSHLQKDILAAVALRRCLGELTACCIQIEKAVA